MITMAACLHGHVSWEHVPMVMIHFVHIIIILSFTAKHQNMCHVTYLYDSLL